jgi:transcription elongation factor GreB
VVLRTPAGKEELDILEVSYPEPAPAPDLDGDSPI